MNSTITSCPCTILLSLDMHVIKIVPNMKKELDM
jgi:hypothetical protein